MSRFPRPTNCLLRLQLLCKEHASRASSARWQAASVQPYTRGNDSEHAIPCLPLALAVLVGSFAQSGVARLEPREQDEDTKSLPENPSEHTGWHLLDDTTRRRVFYKYERRIRDLSQKDKVFHYFAGRSSQDGTRVMSPADLVRAVVAVYPPEKSDESRTGGLAGEASRPPTKRARSIAAASTKDSKFLRAFDMDSDGISYSEFLLLSTFLTIPPQDVEIVFKMFDLNGDGSVHIKEFEEITTALQKRLRKVSSVHRTGASLTQADSSSRGLKAYFFGPKGDRSLKLKDFADFISGMHEEILRLEFEHYDIDEDETMSGLDFARSMVSSVELSEVDRFLDRAASLPRELADMQVTYEQFRHWAMLHQQVHILSVALDFYHNIGGKLERDDFKRASKVVTGKELPDEMVEVVYRMFDTRDGNLSQHELVRVLKKRGTGKAEKRKDWDESGKGSILSCLYACLFDREAGEE